MLSAEEVATCGDAFFAVISASLVRQIILSNHASVQQLVLGMVILDTDADIVDVKASQNKS